MKEGSPGNDMNKLEQRERRCVKYYLVKTPAFIKRLYRSYLWSIQTKEKSLYLTFDDGPHPEITPFVLAELKRYNALATFFCVGKNVVTYPAIYKQIVADGHATGNHTYNHLNGWHTDNETYLNDVLKASGVIDSCLFRPCYGRITRFQAENLRSVMNGRKPTIVMWDVLSGDFDISCTPQQCLVNVLFASKPGSIIVFHDSDKAFPRLKYALPRVLDYFTQKGYLFRAISQ